ncbi:MAG: branched-chain amino acid ABC transporter permease, partial [Deltaproteobacteria bacterium]|nr:branched-chain amino acid ABC transporter permease [Deltaproteobacteria bacterium]
MIQEIVINGLINGSIYALLAIGFSLIFGVARVVNIAHTALYMAAAYFIYLGFDYLGMSSLLAALISILLTVALGLVCYQLFIKPVREHESAVLIATIALAIDRK